MWFNSVYLDDAPLGFTKTAGTEGQLTSVTRNNLKYHHSEYYYNNIWLNKGKCNSISYKWLFVDQINHYAEGLHLKRTKHFTFCLCIHPSINLSTERDTSVIAKHKMEAICLKMCVYVLCIYSYPHFHWNQKLSEVYSSPCFDSIQSSVSIITQLPYANLWGPKYCGLTNPSFVFTCHTKHQSCFAYRRPP